MNIATQRIVIDAGVAKIEVIDRGSGPLIIMLASLGRGAADFDEVAPLVAQAGYRVVCPNPRGFGASTGPMDNITLHDFARDMKAIIEHCGGAPAVMAGHAFGNFIARTTAADFPQLVKVVILVAATHLWPAPPDIRKAITDSHHMAHPEQQLRALQYAFFAPGHDARVWLSGWNEAVMQAERIATDATPKPEWWHAGTAPVLDIIPELDIMAPPHERNRYVNEMGAQRVTTVLIPDAAHALLPEQPAATANAIINYLETLR